MHPKPEHADAPKVLVISPDGRDGLATIHQDADIYRNRGVGTFEEVGAAAGVADPGWGGGAAFFDADLDGDLREATRSRPAWYLPTVAADWGNDDCLRFIAPIWSSDSCIVQAGTASPDSAWVARSNVGDEMITASLKVP